MTDLAPEYVVLTESENIHLVVIRYGDGRPWLRVVGVFPSKERADEYADFEDTFVNDGEATPFPGDLEYEHPDVPEPASALPRFLPARQAPQIEATPAASSEATADVPAVVAAPAPDEPKPTPKPPEAEPQYVPHRKGGSHDSKADPKVDTIVRELYPDYSITTTEIGRRAGIDQPSVSHIAKRLGLPMRGRPGQVDAKVDKTTAPASPAPAVAAVPHDPAPLSEVTVIDRDSIKISTLSGEAKITVDGKSTPLTTTQAYLLEVLLRAAPNPVGDAFVISKLFGSSIRREDAEIRLRNMVETLQMRVLPFVGIELKVMKGIGMALGSVA